ncbi:hypothetical protein ACV229_09040 [Burkholderia sp. MR1-5-21]
MMKLPVDGGFRLAQAVLRDKRSVGRGGVFLINLNANSGSVHARFRIAVRARGAAISTTRGESGLSPISPQIQLSFRFADKDDDHATSSPWLPHDT